MSDPKPSPKSSGPGKIQIFLATSYELQALLYNFDINSSELKPEHRSWITRTIGVHPPPSPGVQVTPQRTIKMTWALVGLASRTGSDALNWRLAKRRAEAVSTAIWLLDPGLLPDEIKFGVGEEAARLAGMKDGIEDERWRAVFVRLYDPTKVRIYTVASRPPVSMDRPSYRKYMLKDKPGKSVPMDEHDEKAEKAFQASREAMQYLSEPPPMQEKTISVPDNWTITQVEYWKTSSTGGMWEFEYLEVKYTWNVLPSGAQRKLLRTTPGDFKTSDMSANEATAWLEKPLITYRRLWL
jgi:hypothetical protein